MLNSKRAFSVSCRVIAFPKHQPKSCINWVKKPNLNHLLPDKSPSPYTPMFGGSILSPTAYRIRESPSPNALQVNNILPHSHTPSPTNHLIGSNILQNHLQNPQFQNNQQNNQQNFQQFQPIQNNFNNLSPGQTWPQSNLNVTSTDTAMRVATTLTSITNVTTMTNGTLENRNDVEMPSNLSSFLDMDSQQLNLNSSDLNDISRMLGISNSNQLNSQFNLQAEEENMTDSFTRLTTNAIDEITKLGNTNTL